MDNSLTTDQMIEIAKIVVSVAGIIVGGTLATIKIKRSKKVDKSKNIDKSKTTTTYKGDYNHTSRDTYSGNKNVHVVNNKDKRNV